MGLLLRQNILLFARNAGRRYSIAHVTSEDVPLYSIVQGFVQNPVNIVYRLWREWDEGGSPARLVSSHNGEQSNDANDVHDKYH